GLIRKSGKDLLNIIEDIIDIAKIEAKQLKIKKKPTKPSELFHDLYKVYHEQLVRSGIDQIELRLNTNNTDKNIQFHTDTERLKQVISNLLNNAIKFTDKGFIEFGYKLENKNFILFYVKDTGIGIPKNMQSRIFDRFVQVDDSTERNNGGTGLGLTISMNIIKLLGGLIQIQSEPGKGSNFYFQLPLEKMEQNENSIPVKLTKNSLKIPDLTNHTILIAEDEQSNYYYLHEILKATNANLIWAKNGLEAINLAEQDSTIELILMDIKMPEINGLEAAKYISNIRPRLPIIAQTANAMDNDMATCLKAGCVDYISKPINRTKLFCLIQRHLKKMTHTTKV
ncbi:MAG: ATP-binding protein, partial [Bacteroidales bacterium]|nr:ATP-binding protein [Bacteroidales bacterium]